MSFGQLERDGFDTAGATPMSDINVTPLVDVMLVLLVIFMVTAPLMVSGLKIDLPQAQATVPVKMAGSVSVVLDRELRLFVDERPLQVGALEAALADIARTEPETEVLLRVDAAVPYGQVAALIGQVQAAGLSRIGFVTEPVAGSAGPAGPAGPPIPTAAPR